MKKSVFSSLALAAMLVTSGASWATYVNSVSGDGAGKDLQSLLDGVTMDGEFYGTNYVYNESNQASPDQRWVLDASDLGSAVMMFEIAGNATTNKFGVYDLSGTGTLELFDGLDTTGTTITLQFDGTKLIATDTKAFNTAFADFQAAALASNIPAMLSAAAAMDAAQNEAIFNSLNAFGFYLDTGSNVFYSEISKNSDGADHLVAYEGDGTESLDPQKNGSYGPFAANEFILAWEDLLATAWDQDYNDMVILVESITPVPEPSVIALLGIGLLGLGFARRRS